MLVSLLGVHQGWLQCSDLRAWWEWGAVRDCVEESTWHEAVLKKCS